jgi:hypothetical protein
MTCPRHFSRICKRRARGGQPAQARPRSGPRRPGAHPQRHRCRGAAKCRSCRHQPGGARPADVAARAVPVRRGLHGARPRPRPGWPRHVAAGRVLAGQRPPRRLPAAATSPPRVAAPRQWPGSLRGPPPSRTIRLGAAGGDPNRANGARPEWDAAPCRDHRSGRQVRFAAWDQPPRRHRAAPADPVPGPTGRGHSGPGFQHPTAPTMETHTAASQYPIAAPSAQLPQPTGHLFTRGPNADTRSAKPRRCGRLHACLPAPAVACSMNVFASTPVAASFGRGFRRPHRRDHGIVPVDYGGGVEERHRAATGDESTRSSTRSVVVTWTLRSRSASLPNASGRSPTGQPLGVTARRPTATWSAPRRGARRTGRADRFRSPRGAHRTDLPLAEVQDAYRELEQRQTLGKIVPVP